MKNLKYPYCKTKISVSSLFSSSPPYFERISTSNAATNKTFEFDTAISILRTY